MFNDMNNKRAFNFDLVIESLEKYYKGGKPPKAYKDIEKFLLKNGFEHRQGSGYVSKDKLLDIQVIDIITDMNKEFSWLKHCIKKFDVTNIGEMYDLTNIFISTIDLESEKIQKLNVLKNDIGSNIDIKLNLKKESIKERMENAKNKSIEINKNEYITKTKSNSIEEK